MTRRQRVRAAACSLGFVASTSTVAAWLVGNPYGAPLLVAVFCAAVAAVTFRKTDEQRERDAEFARRHRCERMR